MQAHERASLHAAAHLPAGRHRARERELHRRGGGGLHGRRRRPNSVSCLADTTTTNTTNLNGASAASSDRIQNFNNGANIFANIGATVDGFGLNLLLSNAGGANLITALNNGVITSSQAVNALQFDGNGGDITYLATLGNLTNTGIGGALAVTSNGGGVLVDLDGTARI